MRVSRRIILHQNLAVRTPGPEGLNTTTNGPNVPFGGMEAGTGMGNEGVKVNSDPEIVALETFKGAVPGLTMIKLLLFNNPPTMVVSLSSPNPLNIKTGAPACKVNPTLFPYTTLFRSEHTCELQSHVCSDRKSVV